VGIGASEQASNNATSTHDDKPKALRAIAIRCTTPTMATTTVTATIRKKDANLPPENERFLRCCADIASALIEDHEAARDPSRPRKDINLNTLRSRFAKKHKINNVPPLTAIIAAVPEHYKKYILPRLIAKPIRELPRLDGWGYVC
jgi:hypothetical protein